MNILINMKQIVVFPLTSLLILSAYGSSQNRISSEKCVEYQKILCPSDPTTFSDDRRYAAPKEFPFMASYTIKDPRLWDRVYNTEIRYCNGVLISENFVLSIMDNDNDEKPKYVVLGDLNLSTDEDDAQPQRFDVIETFTHHSTYYFLLLKLNETVKFNEYIRPACLQLDIPENFFEIGWDHIVGGPLFKAKSRGFSKTNCSYDQVKNMWNICAVHKNYNDDDCVVRITLENTSSTTVPFERYTVLSIADHKSSCLNEVFAIAPYSKTCEMSSRRKYFLRVSTSIAWIESIVWPQTSESTTQEVLTRESMTVNTETVIIT